ncbi:type 4a pilus biogenesis protein PilO [Reinekea sp.]|jgi:type IV pilus assembly protein PilO|uniref:type 4a pilus biogenesis protein PilO n=1 Tax=Reinekea sp. TaxID=1970455 RepID=UPI002A8136C7|nr:type 4a pilus biogenesis protein PilO [Reinekea sp.]
MNMTEFFDGFKQENFDYQNPDFNNMGSWPLAIKVATLVLISVLIVFGFYWFAVKDSKVRYQSSMAKEPTLKQQYQNKSFQVANLDAYKLQLIEMEESFGALLAQLPDDSEMPGLLDDISTTGTQSGLEIDKITPSADMAQEFYIETPIGITVRGSFHEMGNFVSSMSAIPRIVTLHDFSIKGTGNRVSAESEAPLIMTIQAKTYRYQGDER